MLSREVGDGYTKALRLNRLWIPVFMMVGISILSGTAGVQVDSWSFVGIDKLAHFLVFGLLGIAWIRCLEGMTLSSPKKLLIAVGLTTLFGMADEFHQAHNPLRTFEWADAIADFVGAIFWVSCYIWIGFFRKLLEIKIYHFPRLRSTAEDSDSAK
ncbi:MAG: VanZ family protein [Puniceicoccaceae bacterium]